MTNKDFKEGMEVTYKVYDMTFEGTLHKDKKGGGVIVTSPPYVDVYIQDDWKEGDDDITNIQPKTRTIDDLECGDYVVKEDGDKRKCFGKCGEIYGMSSRYDFTSHDNGGTLQHLKDAGYTLYQPTEETDIDKCIKVVEKYLDDSATTIDGRYVCTEIVQELKNLKK